MTGCHRLPHSLLRVRPVHRNSCPGRLFSGRIWLAPLLAGLCLVAGAQELSRLPKPRFVLLFNEEYNDNLFFDRSALAVSDFSTQAVPELQLEFGRGSLTPGALNVQEQFNSHSHEHALDRHLFAATLAAQHQFALGVLSLSSSYNQTSQNQSSSAGIVDATTWGSQLSYSGELGVKFGLTTSLSTGGTRYSTATSSNPLIGQNYTNSTTHSFAADLGRALGPKTQSGLGLRETWDSYAGTQARTDFLNLFFRGSYSAKTEATIHLGVNHRALGTGSGGTFPGLDASINHLLTEKTTQSLTLSRNAAADIYGKENRTWALAYQINVMARNYLYTYASLSFNSIDYLTTGRLNYLSLESGISYRLRSWCNFGVTVRTQLVGSDQLYARINGPRDAHQEVLRLSVNMTY